MKSRTIKRCYLIKKAKPLDVPTFGKRRIEDIGKGWAIEGSWRDLCTKVGIVGNCLRDLRNAKVEREEGEEEKQ